MGDPRPGELPPKFVGEGGTGHRLLDAHAYFAYPRREAVEVVAIFHEAKDGTARVQRQLTPSIQSRS